MARRSVISTLVIAAGAVALLDLTLLLVRMVAPTDDPNGVAETLLYLVYACTALVLLLALFTAGAIRSALSGSDLDLFDVYLAFRDAAMTSVYTGLVGTGVGGVIYFALLLNESFLVDSWRLVPVLCALAGTTFTLTSLALAISFEGKAIRAARTLEVPA